MIRSLWAAASGMQAQQTGIDVIANNLANVNTVGFKEYEPVFADLLYQVSNDAPNYSGTPVTLGSGSRLALSNISFEQGVLEQTGRDYDVAIEGNGFIPLRRPDGTLVFTRDGTLNLDADGFLNISGNRLDADITVPDGTKAIRISKGGYIEVTMPDNTTQQIGRILLANFTNPQGLVSLGDNLFGMSETSGAMNLAAPGEQGAGTINQGFLEKSNVNVAQQLVNMIVGQRAYELSSRAIRVSDEMLELANNMSR